MKKEQIIVISGAIALLVLIYFFGRTVPSGKAKETSQPVAAQAFDIQAAIKGASASLPAHQQTYLNGLTEAVVRGDVKDQKIRTYHQLASFWNDSVKSFIPFAYYTAEAAKLENSEKSLTFAAQLLLENLRGVEQPGIKSWLAAQSKELFEKALVVNPDSDSLKVGFGATFIFGAPADDPQGLMQGIQKILEVNRRRPDFMYAEKMLGVGGIISGQYDKAVERLEKVAKQEPHDLEVLLMLAEGYERKGDKQSAINWYKRAADHIENPALKTELNKRIEQLK